MIVLETQEKKCRPLLRFWRCDFAFDKRIKSKTNETTTRQFTRTKNTRTKFSIHFGRWWTGAIATTIHAKSPQSRQIEKPFSSSFFFPLLSAWQNFVGIDAVWLIGITTSHENVKMRVSHETRINRTIFLHQPNETRENMKIARHLFVRVS